MNWTTKLIAGLLCCTLIITLGGCPLAGGSRTSNQGGGSIVTAGAKFAGGTMTTLTPDEIQVVTDFVIENVDTPEDVDPLTDDQAAAVVQFIQDNNLNTVADIQALIDNPDDVVISPTVQDALEALVGAEF